MFIEHNAHLNTSSGIGWTALHYASQANKPDCVALLIAAGARVDMKNAKGKTVSATPIAQQPASAAEGHSFTAFAERACFLRRMIPSSRSLRSLAQQPASATEGHSFTARACFRRRMIPSSRSLRSLARSLAQQPASAAEGHSFAALASLAPPPALSRARFCRRRSAAAAAALCDRRARASSSPISCPLPPQKSSGPFLSPALLPPALSPSARPAS
jgi:hypothetical protein